MIQRSSRQSPKFSPKADEHTEHPRPRHPARQRCSRCDIGVNGCERVQSDCTVPPVVEIENSSVFTTKPGNSRTCLAGTAKACLDSACLKLLLCVTNALSKRTGRVERGIDMCEYRAPKPSILSPKLCQPGQDAPVVYQEYEPQTRCSPQQWHHRRSADMNCMSCRGHPNCAACPLASRHAGASAAAHGLC
jgi:hypothetical protein